MFILLRKCQPICMLRWQTTTKNFTGHTDNDKCNAWGLEAAAIPRWVKVQHIKGIANIFAESVSRLKAVGIYHDIDSNDHPQELSTPFEPYLLLNQYLIHCFKWMKFSLHLTLNKLCKLMTPYMAHPLHRLVMMSNCHWRMYYPQRYHNWKKT